MRCPEYVIIVNIQLVKPHLYRLEYGSHSAVSRVYVNFDAEFKRDFNSI